MPTYLYMCPVCVKEFEVFHSIKDELKECPICHDKEHAPKRLIAPGGSFILSGGGWAREGYSK